MVEIKLNNGFLTEIDAFRTAGSNLQEINAVSISDAGISLPTIRGYMQRLSQIQEVVSLFGALVKKDATDMDKLAATLKAADSAGGGTK